MIIKAHSLSSTQPSGHARIVPILIQFCHQPAERLDDAVRFDPQRHGLAAAVAVAKCSGARYRTGEHVVTRESRATIGPQRGGVGFGEFAGVFFEAIDFVTLGEHEGERTAFGSASSPAL